MKNGFVKSSPHFFRLILRSMGLLLATLLTMAALIPAPLQTAADPATSPNPAKSAWFLLWIQELVSWSRLMIWPLALLCVASFLLPWMPGQTRQHHARWYAPGNRVISSLALLLFSAMLLLTVTALFFRGSNWSLSF